MFSRFTSARFTLIAFIALGIALLTIGLVKGHFDAQADLPLSSPTYQGGKREAGVMMATPIPPTFTPWPPTATVTTSPATAFSPTPSTISPIPTATASPTLRQAQGTASTPTSTPTAIPSPTFTPTPSGPPPASAPPDRIVSPAIGLDAPVVPVGWTVTDEGAVWDSADRAAGWHQGSAYPGCIGNTVLSGHHNIKGKVFRYLIDLEPDDEVLLYVGDMAYRYVVTEKHLFEEKGKPEEVRRANAQWIAPTDDERLTLVTCWPYTSNTHRLIIVAKPVWRLEIRDWRLDIRE
jgi:LPXTG-site transpeptidase (sortase) family protein